MLWNLALYLMKNLLLKLKVISLFGLDFLRAIIFQKNYRYEEPIPEETVQGFAQGMSRAVEKLSGQVMADVYEAVKNRK